MVTVRSEIASTLRSARHEAGLSQWQLARRSGVSRPTIARLELGQDITVSKLDMIASTLGLEIQVTKVHGREDQADP